MSGKTKNRSKADDEVRLTRRTQGERRADAERRLLESALELLSEKGVAGSTLSEVGERAGYSRGLVAHHYGNKENFLRAVAQHIRASYRARMPQDSQPGLGRLLDNIRRFYSGKAGTFGAKQALLAEAIMNDGPLRKDMQVFTVEAIGFLAEQIRIGVQKGEIRPDVDPEAAATLILGQMRGIGAMTLLGGLSQDLLRRLGKEAHASIRLMLQAEITA